jgi:hypothetical protein
LCNQEKSDTLIDPEEFAAELHLKIVPLLKSRGLRVKRPHQTAAIRRVVEEWSFWSPAYMQLTMKFELLRWADDGGRVG